MSGSLPAIRSLLLRDLNLEPGHWIILLVALLRREPIGALNVVYRKFNAEGVRLMGSTTDKIKGTANEVIGKAKQGVGEAVGSDKLQGEGAIQEVKGKGQQALGDAKEATKDAVDKAAAAANKNL
jgi:uncharacterized protein YjbJ (UPF0337 family)